MTGQRLASYVRSAGSGSAGAMARGATIVLILLAAASCRERPVAKASAFDGGPPTGAGAAGLAPIDALGTIYPRDVPPHPIASRLCEVLHTVVGRRKAECCGGDPTPLLATECARVLGATLHAKAVEVDEAAVERCASAMGDSLAGCNWVTPSPPPTPEACQALVHGKLERGSVCRSSLECQGDMHCEGVSPTKTGLCTPPGGEGAGCGSHVDVLAAYLFDRHLATSHPFCAEHCSLASHKCGPQPKLGSACVANVNCGPSQICVTGQCSAAAPGRRGETCSALPCAEGLRCIDQRCAPLASSAEACSSDMDCAAGGCVQGGEGRTTCGAKCIASLDALRGRDGGPTMRLPSTPRADRGER
ncbi:MAG TPA: hypothetical protein VK540_26450 [Polyangiaceae bacterium]|nr:hypothetical protein [Polyangiaceae bacterium]